MNFIPDSVVAFQEIPVYNHGFSDEEVFEITKRFKEIERRDLFEIPTTREEMRDIIVPMIRIRRTSAFILKDTKKKEIKPPREKKPKKLTKKQMQEKLKAIQFKQAMGEELSEEENNFFNELLQKEI
jgi:hypothetical protein